jgi:hypothetical protein
MRIAAEGQADPAAAEPEGKRQAPMPDTTAARPARDWLTILARYREPATPRSLWELAATVVPFVAL